MAGRYSVEYEPSPVNSGDDDGCQWDDYHYDPECEECRARFRERFWACRDGRRLREFFSHQEAVDHIHALENQLRNIARAQANHDLDMLIANARKKIA